MGKVSTCDSCGRRIEKLETLGHVIQKDYCPRCAKEVKIYLEMYDELHQKTFNYFERGKKMLRSSFKKIKELPDT